MTSQRTRIALYSLNMIVMILAAATLVGIVNWLGTKHYKRWDLAKPSSEALAAQTLNVLKNLDRDVKVTYFFTTNTESEEGAQSQEQWKELLERYKSLSKRFDYEMIDFVKNPQRVSAFLEDKKVNPDQNSSLVVSGEYVEKISDTSEEALTSAIIKVTKGEKRTVCFTEGHGEHDPDQSGTGGYSVAKTGLEQENFTIKKINIIKDAVPADCSVIVIAGPMIPFKPEEAELLDKWMDGGGRMMAMLDPMQNATGLEPMLEKYAVIALNDVLQTDAREAAGVDPFIVFAETYNSNHPITKELSQLGLLVENRVRSLPSFFYIARSLKINDTPPKGVETEALITSMDNVRVLESSEAPAASRKIEAPDIQEPAGAGTGAPIGEKGAQVVAVFSKKSIGKSTSNSTDEEEMNSTSEEEAATNENKIGEKSGNTARLVVFGDSDFAADGFIEQMPSGDIFLNCFAWLGEQESSIGFRAKKKKFIPIQFAGQSNWLILLGVLLIVPMVVFINGYLVWREKKSL